MQDEQLIALGDDAEALLKSEPLNRVVNTLADTAFQNFCNSSPEDTAGRERSYAHYRALIDILNTLRHQVAVRDEVNAKLDEENTGNINQED